MASSSSSATPALKFDVFISFRGPDTRKNFVSHLYSALCRKGLVTYKDDETMEKGDFISEELIKAIKTSRFFIVVISEKYDDSYWCLEELRAIMEVAAVKREEDISVLIPIFYRVQPGRINPQNLTAAFSEMKEKTQPPMEEAAMINEWKNTLSQLANISSYLFSNNVDEAAMIDKVVEKISEWRFTEQERDHAEIVGMRSHMECLASLLEMESDDEVRIIGISGMEGVGKTTIAKYLYRKFSSQFSEHCIINDIKDTCRRKNLSYLVQHLLSKILGIERKKLAREGAGSQHIKDRLRKRKVFVVLDDVDEVEQIHGLAKDKSWFGPGSRIIITTRDKGLLDTCGVEIVYPVKCLSTKDALQMFKQIVFEGIDPPACFEQLLTRVSRLAYGLPSAIKKVSSLCNWRTKTEAEWEELVQSYEETPHKNIGRILKSSYADLSLVEKIAFLYVACLFNGDDIKRVSNLLDDGSESSVQVLVEKSLVDISAQGCINMNTLVENMGRETVVEESDLTPTKQRILWDPQIIYHVLRDKTGTESIEGLALPMCKMPEVLDIERRSFRKMDNVKFLKFHTRNKTSKLQLSPTARLPGMLKLLLWDAYPFPTLPSEFSSGCLVELTLRCSSLQFLWKKNMDLLKLKRLDVSESKELTELPDLSRAIQLEELVVEGCNGLKYLKDLPQSLNYLNAHGCNSLETVSLPSNHSIKHIDLSDCSRLNNDQELITHFQHKDNRLCCDLLAYRKLQCPVT